MSMSKEEICNAALSLVTSGEVETIQDNSVAANQCELFYSNNYDSVLRKYKFRCAFKTATLSALAVPVDFRWASQFQLPSDPDFCLHVLHLERPYIKFEVRGRILLTDGLLQTSSTSVNILYVSRILEGELDSTSTQVMYYSLAILIANSLARGSKRGKELAEDLLQIVADAGFASATEQNLMPSDQTDYSWTREGRFSTTGYYW